MRYLRDSRDLVGNIARIAHTCQRRARHRPGAAPRALARSRARRGGFMQSTDVAGLPVSRLVLGTMTIGDTVDADTAARMLDAAAEAGITMLDTANGYAGSRCEEILGTLR